MPTLYLIVGLPGSGKTTLAKKLEAERNVLRITPDEWLTVLGMGQLPESEMDALRDPIENLCWHVAAKALRMGVDVSLDFGFWSRSERDDYRRRATAIGANTVTLYCPATPVEIMKRIARRNRELPDGEIYVSEQRARGWVSQFEEPDDDELGIT